MNEMLNRILLEICQINPGFTENQLREGFEKVQQSGVYEVPYFGDMMLGGIACGIKKRILIFNTHENVVHDPIAVVDPRHYDFTLDITDETPIVVAYNNYHYENLCPVAEQDRLETIKLVNSYIGGRYHQEYGFSRQGMNYLTIRKREHKCRICFVWITKIPWMEKGNLLPIWLATSLSLRFLGISWKV